jgi:hypothetical protein
VSGRTTPVGTEAIDQRSEETGLSRGDLGAGLDLVHLRAFLVGEVDAWAMWIGRTAKQAPSVVIGRGRGDAEVTTAQGPLPEVAGLVEARERERERERDSGLRQRDPEPVL